MRSVRIIGPGRVGQSFMAALAKIGWHVAGPLGRDDDLSPAAEDVDLLLVTTPDRAVAAVAAAVRPVASTVVAHTSGALALDVLAGHLRRASLHPLTSIPDPVVGVERLLDGCAMAVDGDPLAAEVATALGGRAFRVDAEHRVAYHAAAVVASNHLVALMGQVERLAATAGVPLGAFLDLAAQSLENVRRSSPAEALTGPVARGDWATVERHLATLAGDERPGYRAMVDLAARLAGVEVPEALGAGDVGGAGEGGRR